MPKPFSIIIENFYRNKSFFYKIKNRALCSKPLFFLFFQNLFKISQKWTFIFVLFWNFLESSFKKTLKRIIIYTRYIISFIFIYI